MPKRVLVVEDVEDARSMMRLMIEKQGVSVIEAAGAYEAIEKAEEYQPDLILMDIGLPLLDGLSTASLIKRLKDLDETPIVCEYPNVYLKDLPGLPPRRVVDFLIGLISDVFSMFKTLPFYPSRVN